MTGRAAHCLFLCLFAASVAVGILAGSVGQMTLDNLHCRSSSYGDGNFLAYCRSKLYGDYEHGAIYYGLEPVAMASIRKAQVIFLGSSKTQAGFSSRAVRDYFGGRNIRFFIMGFGYGEASPFALAILKKWQVSPKVVIVNADPFRSPRRLLGCAVSGSRTVHIPISKGWSVELDRTICCGSIGRHRSLGAAEDDP